MTTESDLDKCRAERCVVKRSERDLSREGQCQDRARKKRRRRRVLAFFGPPIRLRGPRSYKSLGKWEKV